MYYGYRFTIQITFRLSSIVHIHLKDFIFLPPKVCGSNPLFFLKKVSFGYKHKLILKDVRTYPETVAVIFFSEKFVFKMRQ